MKRFATDFWMGLFAPLRGLHLLATRRHLRVLAILPFLLSVLIFVVGGFFGLHSLLLPYAPVLSAKIIGFLGGATVMSGFLYWLALLVFVWPVLLFTLLYGLYLASRICAAPFFSLLAERVLIEEKVLPDAPFRIFPWLGASVRMFVVSLGKALVFTVLGAVLFFLSFIPVVNIFSSIGFLLIVAFDMTDYSFEALQLGLRRRFALFKSHFAVFLGFALALGLVFLIPGLSFFLFPASVAGGSDVVRRLIQASR